MVDENTDFFKIEDNFAKTAHIPSIPIIESKLDFVPKVTIAIPTYKRAALLKEALDSAINQIGFDEYDIIVVDNNPERGCETEKLMLTYHEPRLSYYKNAENLGMVGNWNRLFTLAKGEYVIMLHDDDLLLPKFIKHTIDIVTHFPQISILKPKSISSLPLNSYSGPYNPIKLKKLNRYSGFMWNKFGAPTGILIKKDVVKLFGGFNSEFYPISDYVLFSFLANKKEYWSMDEVLFFYRWEVNETLNIKTLNKIISGDYFFLQYLYKHTFLLNILSDSLINCRFSDLNLKKINSVFDINALNLNIKYISLLSRRIIFKLLQLLENVSSKTLFFKIPD